MLKDKCGLINSQDLKKPGTKIGYICLTIFFLLLSLVFVLPPLWTVLSSLKDVKEFIQVPPTIIPRSFEPQKLLTAWNDLDFTKLYLNTITILIGTIAFKLSFCGFAAYVISKVKPAGSKLIFTLIISTMMIPGQVTLVAVYKNILNFPVLNVNLIDTYWPLFMMSGMDAFMIIVYKSFFDGIPTSLIEAAKIDGVGTFGMFFRIILPLSKSVIITSILLTMSGVWGDFFWPQMILKDEELQTIMLAILQLKYTYPVDVQLAGLVFAIVPPVVIFLFLQKYIMEGFTMSGIKG